MSASKGELRRGRVDDLTKESIETADRGILPNRKIYRTGQSAGYREEGEKLCARQAKFASCASGIGWTQVAFEERV